MLTENKKALILGKGTSAVSIENLCKHMGIMCHKVEDKRGETNLEGYDFLLLSPGVPTTHPLVKQAMRKNVKVMGEMEFAYLSQIPKYIAITGTSGKSTTVSLIYEIFKAHFKENVFLLGNIGVPLSEKISSLNPSSKVVLEVSSFQAETLVHFLPTVVGILNVTKSHLDRHKTFQNYLSSKLNLTKNLREGDFLVINGDDEVLSRLPKNTRCEKIIFSTKSKAHLFIDDDYVIFKDEKVMPLSSYPLKGEKLRENLLMAVAIAKIFDIQNQTIESALSNFAPLEHRFETIPLTRGRTAINDSKATNEVSLLNAVKSLWQDTTVLVGGSEKGETYFNFFSQLPKTPLVKNLVFFGDIKKKLEKLAKTYKFNNYYMGKNFEDAVLQGLALTNENQCLLLAPGSASFDQFKNFEERGKKFKEIVLREDL